MKLLENLSLSMNGAKKYFLSASIRDAWMALDIHDS